MHTNPQDKCFHRPARKHDDGVDQREPMRSRVAGGLDLGACESQGHPDPPMPSHFARLRPRDLAWQARSFDPDLAKNHVEDRLWTSSAIFRLSGHEIEAWIPASHRKSKKSPRRAKIHISFEIQYFHRVTIPRDRRLARGIPGSYNQTPDDDAPGLASPGLPRDHVEQPELAAPLRFSGGWLFLPQFRRALHLSRIARVSFPTPLSPPTRPSS